MTARELAGLQGSGTLVSYEADGRRVRGEDRTRVFTFRGESWSLGVGGQVRQAGTVRRIEPGRVFNRIQVPITAGGNVGAPAVSICAIEGDSRKYVNCGTPPAAEFVTRPGDGRQYLTFRRATTGPKK